MRKILIRNAILMAIVSAVLAVVMALHMHSAAPAAGDVYTASKTGYDSEIQVVVTVNAGKIVSVAADVSGETPTLGGKAGPVICQAIAAAGTTQGVDAVAGCTMTSNAIIDAVNECMAQAGL